MKGEPTSLTDLSFVDESTLKDFFIAELEQAGYVFIAEDRNPGLKGYHKRWAASDPDYAARANEAMNRFKGVIIAEMIRRGIHGVRRKKFFKGKPINDPETKKQYVEHEYSDKLLLALAASRMKEFRTSTQEIEHSGEMGINHSGQLNVSSTVKHAIYTDPDYIDYLESKRLEGRSDSAPVGNNGDAKSLSDAFTLEGTQQGSDGDDPGRRGDSAADGDDAAEARQE